MKKILIVIVIVILVAIGAWWWMSQGGIPAYAPTTGQEAPEASAVALDADNTARISQELDSVDMGSLDNEFQGVDKDLNSL